MMPELLGLPVYFAMWGVAAAVGIGTAVTAGRRAGYRWPPLLAASLVVAAAIVVGSKLSYVVERLLFPADDPVPVGGSLLAGFWWHGFRVPGGVMLASAALPPVCAALRLPLLRFADTVVPAIGLAVAALRVGCFLNGCCFGRVTSSLLGMTFPSGRVYGWHLTEGLIPIGSPHTLPVYPVQLYLAAVGLLVYVFGRHWQRRKRYDGEVWLKCMLVFFTGTLLLAPLQAKPPHLNLIVSVLAVAALIGLSVRARSVHGKLPVAVGSGR